MSYHNTTVLTLVHLSPPSPPPSSLQVFKDATTFFSRGTPNLATVIPAMDMIDLQLGTKHRETAKYDYAIRTAMGIAKRTLNKYYELTDSAEAYRITMGTCVNILEVF